MDNFDRDFNRFRNTAIAIWVASSIVSLAVIGVILWAIIRIVGATT